MKRNSALTASTKSTASKRIGIVALSALACLTGVVAQAHMSADSGREPSSRDGGRTKGKLVKISHKKKQLAKVTTARIRPKHKPKPVATTFQNGQDGADGADGQDGVENQDWEQNVCAPYRFWEGCPRPNSFSDQFLRRFWTADLVRQSEADYKKVDRRHPGWFVRDYAATNPGEDMADTFAEFVTTANQPTGTRVVDQKINMFYADPDMASLRNQIRANGRF
jgi:hypothetical protein